MSGRKPIIGVMGGHTATPEVLETAHRLGTLIAERGWILLTGGRNQGVMAAASKGAKQAGGFVLGILPDSDAGRAADDLDLAIVTGMGDARNVINVLTSDIVIACAGSVGTLSEIAVALNHEKRVILLGHDLGGHLAAFREAGRLTTAQTPEDAVAQAAAELGESAG